MCVDRLAAEATLDDGFPSGPSAMSEQIVCGGTGANGSRSAGERPAGRGLGTVPWAGPHPSEYCLAGRWPIPFGYAVIESDVPFGVLPKQPPAVRSDNSVIARRIASSSS